MNSRYMQQGLGWFGFLILCGAIAFVAMTTMTVLPMYLNQMNVTRAVHAVASSGKANSPSQIRTELQHYWDVDYMNNDLTPRDVVLKRNEKGTFLHYDYEARGHLFYNIYVVIDFSEDVPISGVSVE
ncbi:MAG TPA: DUF4845 domain-containing protein [Stenotrophobium sp.]|nr:DUF4845 domain-containing protein [Stenotrophobium sp.]